MTRTRRRVLGLGGLVLAVVAASVVSAAVLSTRDSGDRAAPVAVEPSPSERAERAGNWLARQLDDGSVRDTERDREDLGAAVDIALAFDEVGGRRPAVRNITAAVQRDLAGWTRADGATLVGPTAMALLLLAQQRADHGRLAGDLEAQVSADPLFPGRLRSSTLDEVGDVDGQAYAVRALLAVDSDRTAAAAAYLLQQQCTAGYFRSTFSSLTSRAQGCDASRRSPASVDTTALVLWLLGPVADRVDGADGAMRRAATWLRGEQEDDGSFSGDGARRPNTVTTGLAARALGVWGEEDAAAAAARWIAPLQLRRGLDAGAIGYDPSSFAQGRANGLGVPPPGAWRRSTTQAVAALAWLD